MPLTKCPGCTKEVSSYAGACIHCGYPLASTLAQPAAVQTIELTSKVWKRQQLAAGALIAIGGLMVVLAFFLARNDNSQVNAVPMVQFGGTFVVIGFLWSAIVHGLIWWNHK